MDAVFASVEQCGDPNLRAISFQVDPVERLRRGGAQSHMGPPKIEKLSGKPVAVGGSDGRGVAASSEKNPPRPDKPGRVFRDSVRVGHS